MKGYATRQGLTLNEAEIRVATSWPDPATGLFTLDSLFKSIMIQRVRLKRDHQVPEWID